jgi:hypothetical protein
MNAAQLNGWLPIRFYWQQSRPMVDWCYLGERRLTDPFLEQTIEVCLEHPFNLLFRHQTAVEVLAGMQEVQPGLYPTGFIFHMSRCGSTLISQMLAALRQNIVIYEAGTIDSVLRASFVQPGVTEEQQVRWLRWIVSAMARRRSEEERHLFIKFDSWHTLSMSLILRAFPDVPWLFLYRDPVEVIVSHLGQPSGRMLSGMVETHLLGQDIATMSRLPLEEYCALVLARICETALRHQSESNGGGIIMHYRQLPEAVWTTLPEFFHVTYSGADVDRMRRVAGFNAKAPSAPFVEDITAKKRQATDEVRQASDRWVGSLYAQLEALCHGGQCRL